MNCSRKKKNVTRETGKWVLRLVALPSTSPGKDLCKTNFTWWKCIESKRRYRKGEEERQFSQLSFEKHVQDPERWRIDPKLSIKATLCIKNWSGPIPACSCFFSSLPWILILPLRFALYLRSSRSPLEPKGIHKIVPTTYVIHQFASKHVQSLYTSWK